MGGPEANQGLVLPKMAEDSEEYVSFLVTFSLCCLDFLAMASSLLDVGWFRLHFPGLTSTSFSVRGLLNLKVSFLP